MDVKELINMAAEEDKSYEFYMDAIDLTKDAAAKVWLRELAEEEIKHKDMLLKFDISKITKFEPGKIQNLHITEFSADYQASLTDNYDENNLNDLSLPLEHDYTMQVLTLGANIVYTIMTNPISLI